MNVEASTNCYVPVTVEVMEPAPQPVVPQPVVPQPVVPQSVDIVKDVEQAQEKAVSTSNKSEERDKAAANYRFTKKSAYGMILVAFAAVFGRY